MPCTQMMMPDGSVGIICTRGGRSPKPKPCEWCGRPARFQCDYPVARTDGEGAKDCDAWMCNRCRLNVGPNKDYCPNHAKELDMNDLEKLARGLKRLAVEHYDDEDLTDAQKIVRHTLRGGLRIAMKFNGGDWLVAFWRCNSIPSENELQTCIRDFAIPEWAFRSPEQKKKDDEGEWRGFAFSWSGQREQAPAQIEAELNI